MNEDRIYANSHAELERFCFDGKVTRVFADMIQRSVPGYGLTLQMIAVMAAQYAQEDSCLYDLGCSLGAGTLAMRHGVTAAGCRIIAVDNSQPMLARCQSYVDADAAVVPVDLVCGNIQDIVIENASIVVLNFTLQFIAMEDRLELLGRIFQGLRPGGILVLSEKVAFDDKQEQQSQVQLHEAFKLRQGYSKLEISQKRQALEKVLIPETLQAHHERLQSAGFHCSQTWFQCFNFASMLAFK
ncbi:MAG: carboxy-S-adenosyl-L-methionine synthase CmoA [Mariprofundaceae bacterium]